MSVRKIFFWLHLAVGATGGLVILIMSFTGVLLMYEKQIIEWADQRVDTSSMDLRSCSVVHETVVVHQRSVSSSRLLSSSATISSRLRDGNYHARPE